jgi:excisionase family DNA binding protein
MSNRWPALLSRKDAAEYLGISPRSLSQLKAMGKIRSVKILGNGQPYYRRSELDEFVESLEYGDGHCVASQGTLERTE